MGQNKPKVLETILLYRHECFTGKYTTRNYVRDPSGLFSIISHVSLSVISLYYFIDVLFVYIIKRTLHGGLKI